MNDKKLEIKNILARQKKDYDDFGGWSSLKSGIWLFDLIKRTFSGYWIRADQFLL